MGFTVVALAVTTAACGIGGDDGAEPAAADAVARLDPALAAHLPPGTTMEMAENGRDLFITCSVCHGLNGGGTELGPSLRDREWIGIGGTLEEIERVTREGVPAPAEFATPMPRMGGGSFDDDQIRDLSVYVYVLSHTPTALTADPAGAEGAPSPRPAAR